MSFSTKHPLKNHVTSSTDPDSCSTSYVLQLTTDDAPLTTNEIRFSVFPLRMFNVRRGSIGYELIMNYFLLASREISLEVGFLDSRLINYKTNYCKAATRLVFTYYYPSSLATSACSSPSPLLHQTA